MTTKVAPWLEGLSEAWELPSKPATTEQISSATHDANSLRNIQSRIPRPSLTGLPSSLPRKNTTSRLSTQKRRNPLATLSSNDANTLRRNNGTTKLEGTRSVSEISDSSQQMSGTVQKRSKSSSPTKKQQTLEWKRRLVQGEVGYGDQTELFGPSGLENIFSRSKGHEGEAPKANGKMRWLQQYQSDGPMPSSPPPWPSSLADRPQSTIKDDDGALDSVVEEDQTEHDVEGAAHGEPSFSSNPFDLDNSKESHPLLQASLDAASPYQSSLDKALLQPTHDDGCQNRTISGQTELEQEDFSPVFISKHTTVNGQVDYAALDSHLVKQFQNMQVNLRHPSQNASQENAAESVEQQSDLVEQSTFTDGPESESLHAAPDISFSENLPTGSPFPNLGKNVECKRGGYSRIGSFKHRPLSPWQSVNDNSLNPEASHFLSPIPSDVQELPTAPTPPNAPSTPIAPEDVKSRSSGSPLKLFGAHDTFTNNRLLRRMSELNPDGTVRQSAADIKARQTQPDRRVSSGSFFGSGELDNHAFDAEITIITASDPDQSSSDRSPGSEVPVPGSKIPTAFRFDASPDIKDTFKMKRKLSKTSPATSKHSTMESHAKSTAALQPTVEDVSESILHIASSVKQERTYAEGKRPPTSPFKDPTPKRRRTLHASEIESGIANANQSYHSQLQEAVSSRKRKDARQGESQIMADPETLAQRKMARPRNPTPSQQNRRQHIEAELREAAEEFAEQEPERLEAVMEQIESSMTSDTPQNLQQQAQTLASEVAAFTLRVHKPSGEQGDRKRSVTTQDFLNEAMMVMNLIRAKARPQSNLGSVEESDAEAFRESVRLDGPPEQSLLRVSRPPSREGSGWKPRAAVKANARVISHLRKFQEGEEPDDTGFIANSIASLQVDDPEQVNEQVVIVDEHSNIRITGPPSDTGKGKDGQDSRPVSQRSASTLQTHNSTGTSTERTIGTSSTRKSDNVGTLAPDAVAHLIGDQVGGMTYDKEKQRWVRVSKSPEKIHGSFLELPSNVTSDDDPFREISDLPVDEQGELRRISSPGKMMQNPPVAKDKGSAQDPTAQEDFEQVDGPAESRTTSQETVMARPVTSDGTQIRHVHSSSIPSRYTAFGSSQQEKIETRATSWSDEELVKMSASRKMPNLPLQPAVAQSVSEDRAPQDALSSEPDVDASQMEFPAPPAHHFPQNVATIDHAKISEHHREQIDGGSRILRDDTALDLEESDIEDIDSPKLRQTPSRPSFPTSTYKSTTRQISLRRKTLTNRFAAEVHESSELSFVAPLPGDRVMSLALSVSRPVSTRHQRGEIAEVQSSPSKGNYSFILSDLPDFTVHDVEEERPSERALAKRLTKHAAAEVSDRYALAMKELVRILTDAYEEEPYWEDLKRLDLRSRSLASLHGLNEFCTRIQDLDVSHNSLTLLGGAPSTIRRLNATSNLLSSLTPWNHLVNLQYLDISKNRLENLDGLSTLIHLRELRADDSEIVRIDGLFELDGLLKLRLRRNQLQQVDFGGYQLHRLTELDLCDNQISGLENLDWLCSLRTLKLDGNSLTHGVPPEVLPQLTWLSMRRCGSQSLDVSNVQRLEYLNIDDNCIATIQGLSSVTNLHELSMRRQELSEGKAISILDHAFDTRILRLSGNSIPTLHLSTAFLNIQHLELASVGLLELPDDFGTLMPNLRTLNLNFNNLRDIRPLMQIQKLERLGVCGNRLLRLRKTAAIFGKLTGLRHVDFRDNPLTQGFYPSLTSVLSKRTGLVHIGDERNEDEDEKAAALEKSKYELPPGDVKEDKQHLARLDEETLLRRRIAEVLLAYRCQNLEEVNGLKFDKTNALVKDWIWDRLVELGVVKRSEDQVAQLLE